MKHRDPALGALALYAMLTAALLVLALLGANLYSALTASRTRNENARATLAYIQARVQASDAAGGVQLRKGPEGDALALTVADSGYEVLIYCAEGELVEQTSPAGSDFAPDTAQPVASCSTLSLAWEGGGTRLLSVTADGRQALVALRSGEEQAA